ncbi:MAG TPA: undecaprenyl-phosphate glucose phosphotransferase [Ignavibacteriaceae bacterium]|nr:undecaprenyl-phosphate glucose phosphotransferase [Ignavibacteriaceae bacterium]
MIVNKKSIFIFRLLSDLFLLNIAFITAAVLAQSLQILLSRNYMFILELGLNIVWYFSGNVLNFYEDFSSRYFAFQVVNIFKNVFIQAVVSIIFIFLVKEDLFTRNFIVFNSVFLFVLVSLRSVLFRVIMKKLREKGKNIRNLLIIGAGQIGRNFHDLINENPDFGYNFAGFLDDDYRFSKDPDILGSIDEIEKVIKEKKIEEAVITISDENQKRMDSIIMICNRHAVKTHIIPDYFRYISKKFNLSMIGNFPVITARNEPLDEVQWRFIKRSFDIVFSSFVIIFILSWLYPLIAVLTKLNSKGPVLFVQERVGVRNRKFKCYKFRTLHMDKNEKERIFRPVVENDPRVTSIGRFLRKSNLDELPQFFNVLRGEMSVVGPRPYPLSYENKYSVIVDEIRLRHNIKPGITGWAQIHGLRGDVADEEENTKRITVRIEYDLWYIENWSFWLDLQIILLTVWQMIRGKTRGI